MKSLVVALLIVLISVLIGSSPVRAQSPQPAVPPSQAPAEVPPPPPEELPPAPEGDLVVEQPATGQWVFTAEYGWVFMPYGSEYVSAPADPGVTPYQYVYYPTSGWNWLAAPWVHGWGPEPYFGPRGHSHFTWYRPAHHRRGHPHRGQVYRRGAHPGNRHGHSYRRGPVYRRPVHGGRVHAGPVRGRAAHGAHSGPIRGRPGHAGGHVQRAPHTRGHSGGGHVQRAPHTRGYSGGGGHRGGHRRDHR